MTNIPLVLFLGVLSSVQTHLAKALERQGIEIFEQIKARLEKSGHPLEGGLRKPVIYTAGLILNNTLFIWSTLAQPYGPPALFSSMFGMGLVFLIGYAAFVLKESITPRELAGAATIVAGTLIIGMLETSSTRAFQMRQETPAVFSNALFRAPGSGFLTGNLEPETRNLIDAKFLKLQ